MSIVGNKAFEDGVQFAWDSTSIKTIEACMYKYKLSQIDGWQSREKSMHLRFGGHYATALEHYHKHIAYGSDHETAMKAVLAEALRDTWDPPTEDDPQGGPWDTGDPNKNRANLIRTIGWYLEEYKDDNMPVLKLHDGKPMVEYSFALPVDNDIVFSGHFDRGVEFQDMPWVQDQKTTKATVTSYYFDQYSPDTQMSMYTFAGQAVYGHPMGGVIIDAAQIAVGFSRFLRGFTYRTKSQLNEWYDHTMSRILEAQRMTRENHFPMNPASCSNYGGCPFRRVCSKSPEVRENFLRADFVQGPTWDPLTPR